ncbi:MAG: Rieske (2Fe-2S) protein [Nitrospinota bacterium]
MPELYAGNEAEFQEGDRKILVQDGLEIGVFRVKGGFHAYHNRCAHQGGPVCQGKIIPRVEEDIAPDRTARGLRFSAERTHIVCPWHGYEYDIETGVHPGNRKVRLRKCEVTVRDGEVYVIL